MKQQEHISVTKAIKSLFHILEFHGRQEVKIGKKGKSVVEKSLIDSSGQLQDRDKTIDELKDAFQSIVDYFEEVDHKVDIKSNRKVAQHIKNIMVLVGDATIKLDHYTEFFVKSKVKSITDLEEYKKLQSFYLKHFLKKFEVKGKEKELKLSFIDKIFRRKAMRIPAKVKLTPPSRSLSTIRAVVKDDSYELFHLREENGNRFFTEKLVRDIKYACSFGEYLVDCLEYDPLINVGIWYDKNLFSAAKGILESTFHQISKFYKNAMQFKKMPLVSTLNCALMALMLASNSRNLGRYASAKHCNRYFADFINYLRQVLSSTQYRELMSNPLPESKQFQIDMLDLIHSLCRAFFVNNVDKEAMESVIGKLIEDGFALNEQASPLSLKKGEILICDRVISDYESIVALLKKHPNGPLFKALDYILDGVESPFDPLQAFVPFKQFDLRLADKKIGCVFMPSPTNQKFVQHAKVVDEFKGFMRSLKKHEHCLIFNLQDKTTWKEHARCKAIEDLQNHVEFRDNLVVVTLSKNSDFYYQKNSYCHLEVARDFIIQFKEHLMVEPSGFYFPKKIKSILFPRFVDRLMERVLRVFFNDKHILSRQERLNFIELVYFFLELKIIDIVSPDVFSFTCKDGVDVSSITASQFFSLMHIVNGYKLSSTDMDLLRLMIFEPALMIRERVPMLSRTDRFVHLLRFVENIITPQTVIAIENDMLDLYNLPVFRGNCEMIFKS